MRHAGGDAFRSFTGLNWSAGYVNLTYPNKRDCWPLARDVYRQEQGKHLPRHSAGAGWRQVDPRTMREFDLAVFGSRGADSHVGVVVDRWRMLHLPTTGQPSCVEHFDTGGYLPRFRGIFRLEGNGAEEAAAEPPEPRSGVALQRVAFINPGPDSDALAAPPGLSVRALARLAFPGATDEQLDDIRATLNGAELSREWWDEVACVDGDVLKLAPQPGLFGFNNRLLAIIAITAAMAAGQFWAGPALAGALGFAAGSAAAGITTALTTAAIATAASLLVNALIPVATKSSDDEKGVFGASGFQNEMRLYGDVPLPAGYIRLAPPYGARPYVYLEPNPDGPNRMHLVCLFLEGEGVLIKRNQKIGETLLYKPVSEWADPDVPEFNFRNVKIESNEGRDTDSPHTLYNHQVLDTDNMGVELDNSGSALDPVVRAAPRDCTELEIIIAFPAGLTTYDSASGDREDAGVTFALSYRVIGDTLWIVVPEFTDYSASRAFPFFINHRWAPPARGDYEVKLIITNTDNFHDETGDRERNKVQWFQLYGHRPEYPLNFRFPKATTVIDIETSEQISGVLDSYSVEVSRELLSWNGAAWVTAESSNPADFARFISQSPNVMAKPKTDDQLVLEEFEDLAEFCDDEELEYDESGDAAQPYPQLLAQVLGAGRAAQRYDSEKLGILIDRPQQIVAAHITPRNGFDITTNWDRQEEVHGIIASFKDRTSNWDTKQRRVIFDDVVSPTKWMTLDLPGKTNPREIYVECKRREYELKYQLRQPAVQATVAWERITFKRGLLAAVVDSIDSQRVAAHVRSLNGDLLELDEAVTFEEGLEYQIQARILEAGADDATQDPPANSVIRDVVNPGAMTTKLIQLVPFPDGAPAGYDAYPIYGTLVGFGPKDEPMKLMVISRMDAGDKVNARLSLIRYAPEVYTSLAGLVIPPWDGRVGDIVGEGVAAPTIGAVSVDFRTSDVASFATLELAADPSKAIHAYLLVAFTPVPGHRVQMRWREAGTTVAGSVVDAAAGASSVASSAELDWAKSYEASVRVWGGIWGAWTPLPNMTLLGEGTDTLLATSTDTLLRGG